MALGVAHLERLWRDGHAVYGVTTGYGASVDRIVPRSLVRELPRQMARFHGCGLGKHFDSPSTLALLAARVVSLARGFSGVRPILIERLIVMINEKLLPFVPEEGSVGASGDLTPLSYVAMALMGEGPVLFRGRTVTASQAWKSLRLKPLSLEPKETLAVMNGTSVMTGLACLAFHRAHYLARLSARITALASSALKGNPTHFAKDLFALKDHPGQTQAAAWVRADLLPIGHRRLQDTYALRCAPHVIGVLNDALSWIKTWIEIELNSVNDNPIVDGERGVVLHGGHFYGGHIAFAMDALKTAVANVADLLDRQMALLMDTRTNHGLPANLSGASAARAAVNHGFKAVQIGTSAWAAEALKLTMPASVFSRSTECHNQDKVSMGTIASRDALRILELTEQVAAAALLGAWQGVDLRLKGREVSSKDFPSSVGKMRTLVRAQSPFLGEDRPLEVDLRKMLGQIRSRAWGWDD
jgi:histidine ammonia-lyase